jgi:hypothetical protein
MLSSFPHVHVERDADILPPSAAQGLKQALAATELFFGDDLAKLDTPALTAALDGTAVPGQAAIPSMVVNLEREQVIGQSLERFLIASTLVESKSKLRHSASQPCQRAISAGAE